VRSHYAEIPGTPDDPRVEKSKKRREDEENWTEGDQGRQGDGVAGGCTGIFF
jgi:hypothetical protein